MPDSRAKFVSRAGLKLDHALREFELDVTGLVCADFGCNVGGFTDCLLQRGAAMVIAIDTGYGVLDWNMRNDPRVVVTEKTNVLYVARPKVTQPQATIDLVVIDLGWTKQMHAIPAALRWLDSLSRPANGRIISLIKPHYEVNDEERHLLKDGALAPADAQRVFERVLQEFPSYGAEVLKHTVSPITGGKSGSKRGATGNVEYLVLARPARP